MPHETFCATCQKRLASDTNKESIFDRIRRGTRAKAGQLKLAVQASAEFGNELRIVSAASLLSGGTTVFLIYVVSSML